MNRSTTRIVDPSRLQADAREAFIEDVYASHARIFDGVERASWVKYVVDSKADRTRILVATGEHGRCVGYCAVHFYLRTLGGRAVTVIRSEMGFERAYRGASAAGAFLVREWMAWWARHPRHRVFMQSSPVHPSTYTLFGRYFDRFWPHWQHETPPDLQAFLLDCGDHFGLLEVDPKRPMVREVGWITRDSPAEKAYWAHTTRPAARFFVAQNPGYVEGHGLLTLIEVTVGTAVRGLWRFMSKRGQQRWEKLRARLQRLGIGTRIDAEAVAAILSGTPIFDLASPDQLARITDAIDHLQVPAGQCVFRQGELGDALYVIRHGAAYVVVEGGDEELVVDELTEGAVFGEIALLAGTTRSATIRAATSLTLLRVDRLALDRLLALSPEIARRFWQMAAVRRLETFLGVESAEAPALDAEQHTLSDGEQTEPGATWFLVEGVAARDRDVFSAPALIEAPAGLAARGAARVVRVAPSAHRPQLQ